ncbi:MAG TPA: glycosyltransferase family 1 protein [Anaerolineales bacterium]|nr:glycosyltransferase family 1 protein [Anaerolineales bacterium]
MKILINATPLLSPRSGVGRYTRALGESLLRIDREADYHFFAPPHFSRRMPQFAWETSAAPTYSFLRQRLRALRGYSIWVDWSRRQLFELGGRWRGFGLYHEPNSVPLGFPAPVVLTVLDLSIRRYPQTHPAVRVEIFNRYFYQNLHRVRRIITISHAIKNELIDLLHIPPERIDVIHLAADEKFRPAPADSVKRFRSRRGLPDSYILYLGTIEPRKNLHRLVQAYAALPAATRDRFPLLLAGFKGWPDDDTPYRSLAALVERLGLGRHVLFTGFVPEDELPMLYNCATAFVFPSIYEGFGLPPLEAMQTGLPVIVSTASALREVVDDAGLCVPSDDVTAWADALARVLSDASLREELSARGLRRATQFSWEQCARQTLASYRTALSSV